MYNIANLIMVGKVALYVLSVLSITGLISVFIVNQAYKNNKRIL